MNKNSRYCFLLLLSLLGAISCQQRKPRLPSLVQTFSKKDKIPFGTYVAFHQMDNLFPHNTVFIKQQDFETTWHEMSDTKALYINISQHLYLTGPDVESMMQYVSAGNTMFIASSDIDQKLLDTLDCSVGASSTYMYLLPDLLRYTKVSLSPQFYRDTNTYQYYFYPLENRFTNYDSSTTSVLGYSNSYNPNFISIVHGKGRFFIHLEPANFSNYFLLQKDNYKYLQNVLAYVKPNPEQIFWDDYYWKKNFSDESDSKGSFDFLLKYPALRWAFWLTFVLLFIYILFGGKRRQRIVNIIEPNKNTTVAFTETVGRLYLQQHNNRNIADKIIVHFFEHLRTQYFLNTNQVNDAFIATLSRKSNVSLEKTTALFKTIHFIQNNYDVSDKQLLILDQQIENFTKTK